MATGFSQTSPTSGQGIALPFADTGYLGTDFYLKYPDLLPTLVTSWDNQGFADLLNFNKQEMVTTNETISNYEQGPLFRSVAFATVSGGTATSATVTLSADSYTSVGSITGANISRSPLMERNIIRLPNGVEIRVQSKSNVNGGTGTTYVLTTSTNAPGGFNLGTYLTNAVTNSPTQRYWINSTASAERSTEPLEGLESPLTRYASELQIFRTHSEITGSAAGDRFNIDLTGGKGGSVGLADGHYWSSKQRLEQGITQRVWMGMQFMFGKGGRFVEADGTLVKTTIGMEGYVRAYGNTYQYTAAAFTLADLNALVARINQMQGPRDYMWVMGYGLYAQVQTVLTALVGNAGAIRYDQFGNADPRKKFISLGFNGFNYAGINFHLQQSPTFSHPEMTGLAGYSIVDQGVLIPYVKTEVTTYDNGNAERIALDSVMVRYKLNMADPSQRDRRMVEYTRGIGIHGIDMTKHEMLSHEGLQMVKLRCFIWVERGS